MNFHPHVLVRVIPSSDDRRVCIPVSEQQICRGSPSLFRREQALFNPPTKTCSWITNILLCVTSCQSSQHLKHSQFHIALSRIHSVGLGEGKARPELFRAPAPVLSRLFQRSLLVSPCQQHKIKKRKHAPPGSLSPKASFQTRQKAK